MIGNVNEIVQELKQVAEFMPEASVQFQSRGVVVLINAPSPESLESRSPGTVFKRSPESVFQIAGTSFGWHPIDARDPSGEHQWWARFHC